MMDERHFSTFPSDFLVAALPLASLPSLCVSLKLGGGQVAFRDAQSTLIVTPGKGKHRQQAKNCYEM